ncbi:unnamed protein product, partial [Brassica rapa]
GIPCKHAICVLDDNQDDAEKYVSDYYSSLCLQNTYADNIRPVNGETLWNKIEKPPIGIPDIRKPRGRPKKRDRRKEPFESLQNAGKSTRHGRISHCSRCDQAGHIKSGCKNEPVVVEGPKNRRGRPRKHPAEIHPKRQPKPRKNKSGPSVGSSSQPLQTAQSSYAFPAASSAPQQSVPSNQPAKHVKKASRGRPLKIRKIGNIPSGSGTLWSPFTDRPFEVFGNRVYD